MYDVVIVGAGPAGLQAVTAAASEGFTCCLLEAEKAGGQIGMTPRLENSVFARGMTTGPAVAKMMTEQAEMFGVQVLKGTARALLPLQELDGVPFHTVHVAQPNGDRLDIHAKAVVVATGLRWRRLTTHGIPHAVAQGVATYGPAQSLEQWRHTDRVLVYGGGPSAGQAVIELADKGVHVVWCVRDRVTMPLYLQEGIAKRRSLVEKVNGLPTDIVDGGLGVVTVELSETGDVHGIHHVMLCAGQVPNTEWLAGSGVWRDNAGRLLTDNRLMTNIGGVFAIGDVRQGSTPRVGAAVGDGSFVVTHLWDFLETPSRLAVA